MNRARYLTNDQIEQAYQNLSDEEKSAIDAIVNELIIIVKASSRVRRPQMFGRKQALEVLAKIGILLVKNNTTI